MPPGPPGPPGPGGPGEPSGPPEPPPPAAREAGCIAGFGLALFPVLAWGFAARFGQPLPDALYLAGLLGLLPTLAVAQVPLAQNAPVERIGAYLGSAVMLGVLGGAALWLGRHDPGFVAMGLGPVPLGELAGWTGALLVASAVLQASFLWLSGRFGWEESALLKKLLPRTGAEKRAFAGVSVVAGLGEEIAFRGYAIPALAPVLGGPWAAALFTSGVFGVLHAYQGVIGIVRTALFGGVLAASFVASGSLWPAILAHFAVDLVVGVWLGEHWV